MYFTADIRDEHILRTVRSVMELCGAVESAARANVALCDEETAAGYVGKMKCVVFSRGRVPQHSREWEALAESGELHVLQVPFSIEKLIRIVSLTGQTLSARNAVSAGSASPSECGNAADSITCDGRFVTCGDKTVELTEKEFGLFEYLYKRAGKIVSREEILREVWKRERESNIVDVYASYLRRKLDLILPPGALASVRGIGYVLKI